jgi:hypothetical protein
MKRLSFIFLFSFITNTIWEFLHAPLYVNYQGGAITNFILIRASFWDAVIIALLCLPFLYVPKLKEKGWLIFVLGLIIAVVIEWHALATERWAYGPYMPIVPILDIGFTPFVQLALLGYLAYRLSIRESETKIST